MFNTGVPTKVLRFRFDATVIVKVRTSPVPVLDVWFGNVRDSAKSWKPSMNVSVNVTVCPWVIRPGVTLVTVYSGVFVYVIVYSFNVGVPTRVLIFRLDVTVIVNVRAKAVPTPLTPWIVRVDTKSW